LYDFERIPEDERFYFLVQGGDYDPWEDQAALLSPALGIDEEQIEEIKARDKRMKEIGYSPGSLDPPWWSDCEGHVIHEDYSYMDSARVRKHSDECRAGC